MVPIMVVLFPEKSAAVITAISLVAVFFNGVSGAQAYARLKRIDYRTGVILLLATIPGAVVGAIVISYISRDVFQIVFGVLLFVLAVYIFLRPSRKSLDPGGGGSGVYRKLTDANGIVYEYRVNRKLGIVMNGGVGFAAALLGVGGGIINVPLFVLVLKIPIHIATATSQFMLVGTSFAANVTNYLERDLSGQWMIIIPLTMGTIFGAQLGARISQRFGSTKLARALAVGLMIVGIRLLINGAGLA